MDKDELRSDIHHIVRAQMAAFAPQKPPGSARLAWAQANQAPRPSALGAVVAYLVGLRDERLLFCSGWAASANEA